MAKNSSVESLRKIFISIVNREENENLLEEITDLFEKYLKEDQLNSFEINYFLLNIIYVLQYSNILNIPLILLAKELEGKIITSTINNFSKEKDSKIEKNNTCINEECLKQEDIKNYLLAKTFVPRNGDFKLPEPHMTGNLQVYDDWNGERFKAEVEIDSNGKVVKIIKDPFIIVKDNRSFEEIYGGLLNDILNFEEE